MPSSSAVHHPREDIDLVFTQSNHLYRDSRGKKYQSVTQVVNQGFPKFDKETAAQLKSEKTGVPKEEILKQWQELAQAGRTRGTMLHQNCQRYVLSGQKHYNLPKDQDERARYDQAYAIIDSLKKRNPISIQPEKIVFSPRLLIAGTIDLLVKRASKDYVLFDWKVLKKPLQRESFNGQTGSAQPLKSIPNSNYWHYALQLQIYQNILRCQGYVQEDAKITRALIPWTGQKFSVQPMPDLADTAWELIAWFKGIEV